MLSDTPRPADDEWIANPTRVGVLLVALERRVGDRRPTQRVVVLRLRRANVVDAGQVVLEGLLLSVLIERGVDGTVRLPLLASAVV